MTRAERTSRPVHVLLFPNDLAGAEPLDAAVSDGARAVTVETAGFVRPAGLVSVSLACLHALSANVALTVVRSRSVPVDSYLERVGFYELLGARGAILEGSAKGPIALEPLTRLRELREHSAVQSGLSDCVAALSRFGTRPSDTTRVRQTLEAALFGILATETTGALFLAERYADEAGWSRIEVGLGSLGRGLGADKWSRIDQALSGLGVGAGSGQGSEAEFVTEALARGPGALEVRSDTRAVTASTRAGSVHRTGFRVAGIRIGVIFNAAPPEDGR